MVNFEAFGFRTISISVTISCLLFSMNAFYTFGNAFQVFADHESSLHPLQVPRSLIWSLRWRFVYFGTSLPNIVKGAYD